MVAKTSKELFSFIALQIEGFLKTHHLEHYETHIRRRKTFSTPRATRMRTISGLASRSASLSTSWASTRAIS